MPNKDSSDDDNIIRTKQNDAETARASDSFENHDDVNRLIGSSSDTPRVWHIFAFGDGIDLVDTLCARRKVLRNTDDPKIRVYEQGIEEITPVGTNTAYLRESHYVQNIVNEEPIEFARNHTIPGHAEGQEATDRVVAQALEHGRVHGLNAQPESAHAILLLHADTIRQNMITPTIVDRLDEKIRQQEFPSPIFDCTILPSKIKGVDGDYRYDDEIGFVPERLIKNVTESLARLSVTTELIVPFQHRSMSGISQQGLPNVDIIENDLRHVVHRDELQTLLAYLERLTMPMAYTPDNRGAILDVMDLYEPVQNLNPNNYPEEVRPAPVFAPAHVSTRRTSFDGSEEILSLLETLRLNKLAEFDPETAWGCMLVFYGPQNTIESLRSNKGNIIKQATEIFNPDGGFFQIYDCYFTYSEDSTTRLLAGFWNPKMQIIEDCHSFIEGNVHDKDRLAQFTDQFERVYQNTGMEAFD